MSKPNLTRIADRLNAAGGYLLGEGHYSVKWILFDARPVVAGDFDTISKLVKSLKGKAVQAWSADEFEKAIAAIESSIRPERSGPLPIKSK